MVAFGGQAVVVLAIEQRFAGSNPTEDDELLRAIKTGSTSSFGGEVKPSVQCRTYLRHVKDAAEYEKNT
jgi:hypothetical protein